MSSYVQRILLPDERVVYAAIMHWIIYLQGLAFVISGGLFGYNAPYLLSFFMPAAAEGLTRPMAFVGLGIIVVGIILLLGAYVRQTSTELVLTNRRVIAKYGFISRNSFEIMVNRVSGAHFDQTVMGRIMGYGTIIVRGAGGDISPFDEMAEPQVFHKYLMSVLEHAQQGRPVQDGINTAG